MKKNQKLCWNCEGEVDKDAIVCLYCGADLSEQSPVPVTPPYRSALPAEESPAEPIAMARAKEATLESPTEEKSSPIALFFLLPGVVFLVFSLLLVFFSIDGTLTLQWSSRTWYLYFVASLPLFYFGYRLLP